MEPQVPHLPRTLLGQLRSGALSGAPVPSGADSVVMIEDTQSCPVDGKGQKRIQIKKAVDVGDDIRPIGCDIR